MHKEFKKEICGSLELKPILSEWQKLMSPGFWNYHNDAPWWYNERALLSLLAGAIWKCTKCNGWAFEEFTSDKWRTMTRGNRKKGKGRGDIMFGIGDLTFIGEAKQCWPILKRSPSDAQETIDKTMRKALSDASCLPPDGKRLGIVFVTPRIHKSNLRYIDEIFERFTEALDRKRNTAMAWTFPPEKRVLNGKDGYRYPGIVLLIKRFRGIRKWTREKR